MLETQGGACIQLSFMIKIVLENLGFNVFQVAGEATWVNVRKNHAMTVVKLTADEAGSEQMYLLDIGLARPVAGPINLSNLPERRKELGCEVEYRYNPETKLYERILLNGCPITGPKVRISSSLH